MFICLHRFEINGDNVEHYIRTHEYPNIYEAVGDIEMKCSRAVFTNFCIGIEATFSPSWDYDTFRVVHDCIDKNINYCIKVGNLVVSKPEVGMHNTYDIFFRNTY